MSNGMGLNKLKKKLVDVAFTHPQLSISKVQVPAPLVAMQLQLQFLVKQNSTKNESPRYYLEWTEYENLCASANIHIYYLLI